MFGEGAGGSQGVDDDFVARSLENVGAFILGRNMFGPIRGAWPDDAWKGWWGPNPPYHTPVFVLTHHARPSITMEGGTAFHFVTDGIEPALACAREAAGEKDVRIGGGANVVRAYLRAGLSDRMHLAISPIFLGSGEHVFAGLDLPKMGFACSGHVTTEHAMHVVLTRRRS